MVSRDHEDFAKDAAKIKRRGRRKLFFEATLGIEQDPHHVLDVHEAENVVFVAAVDGDAGALRGGEGSHDVIQGGFDGENVHVWARNHDLANLQVTQFDGAEDELLFPGSKQAPFARLLDLDLELFGGMGDAVPGWEAEPRAFTMAPEMLSRKSMAQRKVVRNHRNGRAIISATRSARARLMVLGTSSPRTTWTALRKMNAIVRAMPWISRSMRTLPWAGMICWTNWARVNSPSAPKGQAGEGDAELYAGDDTVKIAQEEFDDLRPGTAFDHELAYPRHADGHQRKLRGRKEAVQHHEQEHTD